MDDFLKSIIGDSCITSNDIVANTVDTATYSFTCPSYKINIADGYTLPKVKSVIFSGPATTVIWADDTKTTVKVSEGQQYDRYAGFAACVCKKIFGSTSAAKKILDEKDTGLIRARKEAEAEEKRRRAEEEQAKKRAAKKAKAIPSYEDFQNMVSKYIVEAVARSAAEDAIRAKTM